MIIIQPQVLIPITEIEDQITGKLERYARVCYKSEQHMEKGFNPGFLKRILSSGHESVIEHEKITVMFICDRGITHEIVRHRIGSYSQESTRYCNYSQDRFGQEITVIEPYYLQDSRRYELWVRACEYAEKTYMEMLQLGMSPQEARAILPTCLKTEIVVTYNIREWRHFFKLRCAPGAHPQMRQLAIPLLKTLQQRVPILFDNLAYDEEFPAEYYAHIQWTDAFFNPLAKE